MDHSPSVSDLQLQVEPRAVQKKSSRKLQRLGMVPAVVYGSSIKNLYFSLKENDAKKYSGSAFENKIFTLSSSNKKLNGLKVLKKSVSYNLVTRKPIHIDFLILNMSKKIKVTVEMKFSGKAKGVKEQGGVFNIVRRNIEVECFVNQIPEYIEMDVSDLGLNESYHVSDLTIPEGIKLITKGTETLCLISKALEEEVKVEAAPVEGENEQAQPAITGEDKDKDKDKDKNKNKKEKDSAAPKST